jgi:NAD dependent epimerase/dehydratase family
MVRAAHHLLCAALAVRVVVIGGLGNFGARICKRLAQEPGLDVIATSRRQTSLNGPIKTAALDLDGAHFVEDLKALAPDLVIHCAGPFQDQDYRVALASMVCKAHYIDLADGRDFVIGFNAAVDAAAQTAGRLAVTGASTLPALSSAVVDRLTKSLPTVSAIDIVIAPGQHAPRGAATMAAVLGYAGRPFLWWQDGAWRIVYGWQDLRRTELSFGNRWAAACDVPDLALLPARYPGVQTVTFRAALEVSLQHYALWLIAGCRRLGLGLPMARLGSFFDRVGTWLNCLGSGTGGMTVSVTGWNTAGQTCCRLWEVVAKDNHGPEIPCMAAVILACRLGRGEYLAPGAQVCTGMLELADFEPEFARWNITTQVREC